MENHPKFKNSFERSVRIVKKEFSNLERNLRFKNDAMKIMQNVLKNCETVEKECPEELKTICMPWVEENRKLANTIPFQIEKKKFSGDLDRCKRGLDKNHKLCIRDARFIHDVKRYQATMIKDIANLEKSIPESLKNDSEILDFIKIEREKAENVMLQIEKAQLEKEMNDSKRRVVSELKSSKDALNHYNAPKAWDCLLKARKVCKDSIENNPKFFKNLDLLDEFLSTIFDEFEDQEAAIKNYELKRKIDDIIRNIKSACNSVKNNADRRIFDRANTDFVKCKDLWDQLSNDEMMSIHPIFLDFIPVYDELFNKTKTILEEKILTAEAQQLINNINSQLGTAKAYIKSSPSRSMEYYNKGKDMVIELENEKYSDLKNVQSFWEGAYIKFVDFEREFKEKQLKDAYQKAKNDFGTIYGNAETYFKDGNVGDNLIAQSMEFIEKAKDMIFEISLDTNFVVIPEFEGFLKESNQKIADFETKVGKKLIENEIKEMIGNCKTKLGNARVYFDRHDDSGAIKFIEEAGDIKEELELHPVFSKDEKVVKFLKEFDSEKEKFWKQLKERIEKKEFQEITINISSATSTVKNEKNFQKALEVLSKLEELIMDFEIKYPEKKNELKKYNETVMNLRVELDKKILKEEMQKESNNLHSLWTSAKAYVNDSKCLEYISKTEDKIREFEMDPKYANNEILNLEKWKKNIKEVKNEFSSIIYKAKIVSSKATVDDSLRNVKISFDRQEFAGALENLEKAKDKIEDLIVDDEIAENKEMRNFIDEALKKIQDIEKTIGKTIADKALLEQKRNIDLNISNAKSYFESHRNAQSLEFIEKAKDGLEDIKFQEHIEDYMKEVNEKIKEFYKNFAKREFQKEIKKTKQAIEDSLRNAEAYFIKSKSSSLKFYTQAKEQYVEFVFDEKFKEIDDVQKFEKAFAQKLKAFKTKFDKDLLATEIKDIKSSILCLGIQIKSAIKIQRYAKALEVCEKVDEKIDDLQNYSSKDSSLSKYIQDQRKINEENRATIFDASFKKEIQQKINSINTLLGNAKVYFERNSVAQALDYIERTVEIVEDLNDEKFITNKTVNEFFITYNKTVKDLKKQISDSIYAKEIKEATGKIQTTFNYSKVYFERESNERSLSYLEETKAGLQELKDNNDLNLSNKVMEFSEKTEKEIDQFEKEFNEKVFKKQITLKQQRINELINQANTWLSSGLFSKSLDAFEKAKDLFSDLKEQFESSIEDFSKEYYSKKKEFSEEFAKKALLKESKKLESKVQDNLRLGKQMFENDVHDKALEYIAKSRQCISEVENKMVLTLENVKNSVSDIEKVEKDIAWKILNDEVTKIINKSTRIIGKIEVLRNREATKKAQAVFEELLEEIVIFQDEPIYKSFDKVKDFIKSIKELAKSIGIKGDIFSKKTKTGNTGKQTGLFPKVLLPKKMKFKKFAVGVGIKPALFDKVKLYNKCATSMNSKIREYERLLDAIQKASLYQNYVLYTESDLHRHGLNDKLSYCGGLNNMKKNVLRYLEPKENDHYHISPELAKEQIVVDMVAEEKKFLESFDANYKHLESIKKIQVELAEVQKAIVHVLMMNKQGIEIANFSQCPRNVVVNVTNHSNHQLYLKFDFNDEKKNVLYTPLTKLKVPYDETTFTSEQFASMKGIGDHRILLQAYQEFEKLIKRIEADQKKYPGFPFMDLIPAFKENMANCLKIHASHCAGWFANHTDVKIGEMYWDALVDFPLARKYALKHHELLTYQRHERQFERISVEEKNRAPKLAYYKTVKLEQTERSKNFIRQEEEEDYEPYTRIIPGKEGNEIGKKFEAKDGRYWTSIKDKFGGKICFSDKQIKTNERDEKIFKSDFVFGKDEIFGRCYWKNNIHNLAIGIDKKTKKAVYPEKFNGDFLLFVSVDGKYVLKDDQTYGEFWNYRTNGSKDEHCLFQKKQDLGLFINQRKNINIFSHYENLARKFDVLFGGMEPGKHKIRLELRYKLRTYDLRPLVRSYPLHTTLLSESISSGDFNITIPKDPQSVRVNPFPIKPCKISNKAEIEKCILDGSHRHNLGICLFGDYRVCKIHWFTKKPILYGANYYFAYYFEPKYEEKYQYFKESIRMQERVALTLEYDKNGGACRMPPVYYGGASTTIIDADFFPPSVYKKWGVERIGKKWCDEWKTSLSENDKRFLCKPFDSPL